MKAKIQTKNLVIRVYILRKNQNFLYENQLILHTQTRTQTRIYIYIYEKQNEIRESSPNQPVALCVLLHADSLGRDINQFPTSAQVHLLW